MPTALLAFALFAPPLEPASDIERFRPYYLKADDAAPKDGAVKVTFLGTATLLIDDGETQILIDGFFTRPRLAKIALSKIETDAKLVDTVLQRVKADRVKAVLVCHSHYDHALDCAYVAKATKAKLYGSSSTLNVGRGGGLPEEQLVKLEPGREVDIGRFKFTAIPSKHSPPMKGVNDDLGQTIDKPLKPPADAKDYKEGGSFDFLLTRGGKSLLVKASCAFEPMALDNVKADVLFLGTATLGLQTPAEKDKLYAEIIGKVKPKLVIPIHWDNFFSPLTEKLGPLAPPLDDIPAGFDFLIERLNKDDIRFGILQGFQSTLLFAT